MAKNTVILKNSSVPDKMPTSAATVGEVFVNYASGDGKSFLSTKKADDTIATFHEDAFWDGRITAIEETIGDISTILNDVLYNF